MPLHATEPLAAAMTYPGNQSLAADVRARILATFRQSVEAASRGDRDQALLGCDFIQRLDPDFAPATTLQQMLEAGRSQESFAALLLALEDEAASRSATVPIPAATPLASSTPGLVATFSRLLEARRFADLLAAAQAQTAAVGADAKLRELVATAQSRYEAEPFVQELLDNARRALGSGELDAVADFLEKVRGLDPTHPGLAEIDRLRSSAISPSATGLEIDWDDEEPAPTQVAPPAMEGAPETEMASDLFGGGSPVASPQHMRPARSEPAFGAETPLESIPDLDLPEIDFTVGDLPDVGAEAMEVDAPATPLTDDEPAASGGEAESGERVQALLDEGQAAFDRGEYQGAIDAWSRIFLIDIDNQDAAQRIEKARQLKAEQEREVEEVFHAAVARFDAGEWDAAREAFRRVLEEQPSYVLAREYLDKIDEREAAGGEAPGLDLPEMAPLPLDAAVEAGASVASSARPSAEAILIPPEPGSEREARRPAVDGFAVKARRSFLPSPRFLAIGGAVLALLIAGGWYVSSRWDTLFPNSSPPVPQAPAVNPIVQAQELQAEGKTAVAIATLRRIPPQHGAYAEAQSLISQWEKLASPQTEAPPSPSPEQQERAQLLVEAKQAAAGDDNYLAHKLLAQAAAIAALDGEWAELDGATSARLAEFDQELGLMRDGEYEMALNRLWRRHEADPSNLDARRLMIDAYYNLSLSDLRRGDPRAARAKLRDALELDSSDPLMVRLERFCAAYERRNQDLLYRIFVKYLPQR